MMEMDDSVLSRPPVLGQTETSCSFRDCMKYLLGRLGLSAVSYWKIMRYSGRCEISADRSQITQAPSQN